MYLSRISIIVLLLSFFALRTVAQPGAQPQTGSISGKLVDGKNNPVSYATVTLVRSDSSVVNGDLSKEDGTFKISPTGTGTFRLRIESLGLANKSVDVTISPDAPDKNMGTIKVAETENKLNEVDIVGEKPVMELKVDKKVFNVEKNTTTAGGSATDVLQNVPSVSVDADGNVSLRGKSDVTILIDGKPATMLGSDVNSALQSLPASSIADVEVITNPSAKYDAQGTGGIINIITKKDNKLGINGNATLGVGNNDKYNGNLGLNVRKGKWNYFLNSSFRLNSSYNNVITDRTDNIATNGIFQQYHTYEHVPRDFNGNFNTIGATFDPNKYNSITLTENLNFMEFRFKDNSDYNIYNGTDSLERQYRYSKFSGEPRSTSTALDYKHKFKKKDEELSVDGTFAYTSMERFQDYNTTTHYPGMTDVNYIETAPGTGNNSSLNVWADYSDPLFTKNGKLGLGVKSQLYWFHSTNNPVFIPTHTPDYTLLSDYNYSQQTHAGYVNWSDQLGKFSYQAGLRVEDANYSGDGAFATSGTKHDTTLNNTFLNLFPSAFISYQLTTKQSVYLNYSRRVNRPGFMQLLPFVDLSNPSTVNTGNPALIPEFINNVEFAYNRNDNKGNNFILSAYYAQTQNLNQKITRPLTPAEATNFGVSQSELFTQPVNIASGTTYGLEGTGHVQILPIWDATLNVNLFQNDLKINHSDTAYSKYLSDNSGFSWFGKINTNLKLPKNFSFQVNANYESPKVIAQGHLKETYWVDVALRKNFWKNKATLILNCSDIFKTHTNVIVYNLTEYSETINRIRETRIGNITFTYRFGKSDIGNKNAGAGKRGDDKLKPVKPNDEDRQKNLKEGGDDDNNGGGGNGGNGGGVKKDNAPRN